MKGIDKMKEVVFELLNDKLSVKDESTCDVDVSGKIRYHGVLCSEDDQQGQDHCDSLFPEKYKLVRVFKHVDEKEMYYSVLSAIEETFENTQHVEYNVEGILYSKTRILRGAVLKCMLPDDTKADKNAPSLIV